MGKFNKILSKSLTGYDKVNQKQDEDIKDESEQAKSKLVVPTEVKPCIYYLKNII